MEITLNGEARTVPAHCHPQELVALLGLAGRRIAMEVNGEIVPRSRYREYELAPGDCVEVVHAVGGG